MGEKSKVKPTKEKRPPDQEDAAEAFLLQLQEPSCLQALILLGYFSHPQMMHLYCYLLYNTL